MEIPVFTRLFTNHPSSVGETYTAHMMQAMGFSARMLLASGACLVHAVFPFLFTTTGSDQIRALHLRLQHRQGPPAVGDEAGDATDR